MISISANIEDNVVVVEVSTLLSTILGFKAFTSSVSDVSGFAVVEGDFLIWLSLPGSDRSTVVWSVLLVVSLRDHIVSSVELTNGIGSSVEGEPSILVVWSWFLKGKSVVSASDVLGWDD